MKRIGGTLTFAGIVMLVGPFFGFTIRGQQDTDYEPVHYWELLLL